MMNPNAKLIARRSASVTAGTALPASVSVAITEPGPTRTNAAVPNVSAIARCEIECMVADPLNLTSVRQCRTDFTNRSPAEEVCQQVIWGPVAKIPAPGFGLVSHRRSVTCCRRASALPRGGRVGHACLGLGVVRAVQVASARDRDLPD